MYNLQIQSLSGVYNNIDAAMEDCFCVYPEADFSGWNSDKTSSWIDIHESNNSKTIIGRITEVV